MGSARARERTASRLLGHPASARLAPRPELGAEVVAPAAVSAPDSDAVSAEVVAGATTSALTAGLPGSRAEDVVLDGRGGLLLEARPGTRDCPGDFLDRSGSSHA